MINISASKTYFKIPLSTELLIKQIKPLGGLCIRGQPHVLVVNRKVT